MAHVQINVNEATNLRFLFAFFVLGLNQMFVVTEMVFPVGGHLVSVVGLLFVLV